MSVIITSPTPNSTVPKSFSAQGTVLQPGAQINGSIGGKNAHTVATSNGNWVLSFSDVPVGTHTLRVQGDERLEAHQNINVTG